MQNLMERHIQCVEVCAVLRVCLSMGGRGGKAANSSTPPGSGGSSQSTLSLIGAGAAAVCSSPCSCCEKSFT